MVRRQERGKCRGISYSLSNSLLRIPVRVRRPLAARKALRFSPLVQACWAHSSSVERIPLITALAESFVFVAGRPAAQRAADAGARRIVAPVDGEFAVNYGNGGAH